MAPGNNTPKVQYAGMTLVRFLPPVKVRKRNHGRWPLGIMPKSLYKQVLILHLVMIITCFHYLLDWDSNPNWQVQLEADRCGILATRSQSDSKPEVIWRCDDLRLFWVICQDCIFEDKKED
ncbi:hypothetical protein AB3S75_044656 [Citrus x aurantiifolia]